MTASEGGVSGFPRPRSTTGSPASRAAAATRASSAAKYCSGRRSSRSGRGRTGVRLRKEKDVRTGVTVSRTPFEAAKVRRSPRRAQGIRQRCAGRS